MCFVLLSGQTAASVSYNINRLVFMTEVESVYCAVRTEALCKTKKFVLREFICLICAFWTTDSICDL